jgi:3-oxoacyl-[acyl-carrier protein] reductase
MEMNMTKTALITGASRGIGAAIAEELSRDGFNLVLNYTRGKAEAESLAARLKNAIAVQGDVADTAQVASLFDQAEARFGGVDVVVANAGVMELASIADSSDALFERMIAVNLTGAFNTLREAAKRTKDDGRIISVTSTVTKLLLPTYGVYAATKAAVEAMTITLAKEVRGRQISVNAVAPGGTATDLFLSGKSDADLERFAKMSPLERLGQPADTARVVAFLAGDKGGWVNGQIIRVNGGVA